MTNGPSDTNTITSTTEMSDRESVLTVLNEIRAALAELSARVRALEGAAPAAFAPAAPLAAAPPAAADAMNDDTLAVIAAAVAAFLGKRAHVRQVRLISSSAWAQQGRVSVQASHRLER
jgi:methylmalonyl-CoA carboxyltransferase large subunit